MNRIVFLLTSILLRLISKLPFSVLYILSDLLFLILFYVIRYRRKVVITNLNNSFPEKSKSELAEIEKRFYQHLADLILESIKTISISPTQIKKRFVFKNLELLEKHLQDNKSVIAVTGHYGNWEWGPIAIGLELREKVLVVYKPLSDKNFEGLINTMRSRFGAIMVPMKQTIRKVVAYKKEVHVLVLVGDQTPTREELNYFTSFLNQQTAIFLGVEKIALMTNNPVIFFSINKTKRGYYECLVKSLVDNPEQTITHQITNLHTRELEQNILAKPEYWLWSHKRWKFSPKKINN